MKRIILLVGAPGSGKTTVAQKLVDKGFHKFCADDIREQLYGDAKIQGDSRKVFAVFFDRLEHALKKSYDVVIDNTNVYSNQRQSIIQRARKAGYTDIQLWIIDTPLELCLKRNGERSKNVPDEHIVRVHQEISGANRPDATEGKVVVITKEMTDDLHRLLEVGA